MNITKLNDIFITRGVAAALDSARAAQMSSWIIQKLENSTWEPGLKKSLTLSTIEDVIGQPIKRIRPRVGKTAREGGLAVSQQRKRAKSAADRELRTKMKSAGGKGK